ncbi:MAG: hypothetical protein IT172_04135 [Acidobacteria bacterium]|nr:hypothetical protein [Acidobacteriota bacterium]
MKIHFFLSLITTLLLGSLFSAFAQTDTAKPKMISGDVVSVSADSIVIKTATGTINAKVSAKTEFKRAAVDDPKKMTPSVLSDIAAGDKVIVSGFPETDGKTVPAIRIYLMSKAAIDQQRAKEAEEWRTRGITGTITSVDPVTSQITVETAGLAGIMKIVVTPKSDAVFRRYSTTSVKFADSKPSSFGEIAIGDKLRAKGDKSADGTSFSADEIITGAFQTVAGTIKSVDPTKNEIVITELSGKKDVTISFTDASMMKRFPPEFAERMAGMQRPGGGNWNSQGGPPRGQQQGGQERPSGQGQPGGGMRPEGAANGSQRGLDEMIDRFPNVTVGDLNVGEMIAVSSTKTQPNETVKAIKLVAGVEPFVKMAQARAAMSGSRSASQQPGLNIPGLDDFGGQ